MGGGVALGTLELQHDLACLIELRQRAARSTLAGYRLVYMVSIGIILAVWR